MAQMTLVSGVNVCGTFTAGRDSVMTTDTVINKRCVVYRRRYPGAHGVTGIAFIRCRYMGCAFTRCRNVIVTTATHTDNLRVVYGTGLNWNPGCSSWLMTGFTESSRINMGCRILSGRNHPIVTFKTWLTGNSRMIKVHEPAIGRVAYIAGFRGHHMIHTHTTCNDAIMTADAGTDDLRMIRGTGW